ncbi:MAG: hypothetical protein ABSG80_03100 [Verrucomicrobiota bacterium]|jgi:hypothetical protein
MEALQTKGEIEFFNSLEVIKNSAKSVTVAQLKCRLAQLGGAPASGSAGGKHRTFNIPHPTSKLSIRCSMLGVEC